MAKTKAAAQPSARDLGGELRRQLKALLDGGQAHAGFDKAVKNMPAELCGVIPKGMPYSAWQLLEHMRIAQHDILNFCNNSDGSYRPLKWPGDYWPKDREPPSASAWQKSVKQIRADRDAFDGLMESVDDTNFIKPFPWGDGQNLLHEALLIADHNAYHVGELVVLRRLLGAWKS
jgi:hypothetical protein